MKGKFKESTMRFVFALSASMSILAVITICVFMFAKGFPAMAEIGIFKFLFGTTWRPLQGQFGILPMIVGSLYVTAGAVIIGVPLGMLCAVFMAHFCPKAIYKPIKAFIDLLAGIPSIVYGFFGLTVIVPLMQNLTNTNGKGILSSSIMLGMMILPTIISVTETSLRAVPKQYYEGSLALGATHERSIFSCILPAAKSGIIAAVVLGIGRAIGETMAVVMIAGNSPIIPTSITSMTRTLTSNIALEMAYSSGLHKDALIATAVVLFVFILIINISVSLLKQNKKDKKQPSKRKKGGAAA